MFALSVTYQACKDLPCHEDIADDFPTREVAQSYGRLVLEMEEAAVGFEVYPSERVSEVAREVIAFSAWEDPKAGRVASAA